MSGAPDHAPNLERAFAAAPREAAYRIREIEGAVPEFVRGRYAVNGPALFGRGEQRYGHWLDGDGMVACLDFTADGVTLISRFVRSHKWADESARGRSLYRGFGTAFEGDQLQRGIALASPVNVSVYPFGGRLLAFGEQGLPWELDPETLETRGEFTFDGQLNPISPFSAHPHFSADGGEFFNFGVSFSSRRPTLHLYRFETGGRMIYRRRLPIDYPSMTHDFMLGRRHVLFYQSPHVLNMETLARGGGSVMDALEWRPELGSQLLVIDRETGELRAKVPVSLGYSLHLISSFESEDRLMLDLIELDQPIYDQYRVPYSLFTEVRRARPVRFVLDLESLELIERRELDYRMMCDFPAIDPRLAERDYRDFWVLGISATELPGRKFFDQLVHCDWRAGSAAGVWQAPAGCYLGGEPVLVPDGDRERAGAVICQQWDTRSGSSAFLIFNAFDVAAGPLATLHLESPLHLGFHATFEPATIAP
ncbi:MAG: carotenoid oxygenase family protein [Acidobacteriota bacterium]